MYDVAAYAGCELEAAFPPVWARPGFNPAECCLRLTIWDRIHETGILMETYVY